MAELVKRMQNLENEQQHDSIDTMTLEELARTKVSVGKTHNGETFSEMWRNHRGWVQWMLKTYEGSTKPQHRMLARFVELQLDKMEADVTRDRRPTISHTVKPKAMMTATAKSKARASPSTATTQSIKEEQSPSDEEAQIWEMAELEGTNPEVASLQSEMVMLSGRMDHIESLLSQVVSHIQQTTAKPQNDPWE